MGQRDKADKSMPDMPDMLEDLEDLEEYGNLDVFCMATLANGLPNRIRSRKSEPKLLAHPETYKT